MDKNKTSKNTNANKKPYASKGASASKGSYTGKNAPEGKSPFASKGTYAGKNVYANKNSSTNTSKSLLLNKIVQPIVNVQDNYTQSENAETTAVIATPQRTVVYKEKISFSGSALLAPVPSVIVTCGSMEQPQALTIAWTGILSSDPPKTYISVRKQRNSYETIKKSGEFVINLVNKKLVFAADYCGIKSGKNTDKFEDMYFDKQKAKHLSCPTIAQSPLNIECKVTDVISLGSHDMFMADIVGVNVDPRYIDDKGKICLDKAYLVSYCHGEYFLLGDKLGQFGFSTKSKKERITNKK